MPKNDAFVNGVADALDMRMGRSTGLGANPGYLYGLLGRFTTALAGSRNVVSGRSANVVVNARPKPETRNAAET